MSGFESRCEIDGEEAGESQLAHVARFNHGHFTSLQVRDGGVRGLDLHLARLRDATRTLYDAHLDPDHVRDLLRHALRGTTDASARISVFAPDWNLASMTSPTRVAVMIHVQSPREIDLRPLRLRCVEHERFLPQIKHVGTFALLQHRADARRDGFDDALFVDRNGHVSEGTLWNIGYRDGGGVVLPNAPQLDGIAMRLLQQGLQRRGIGCERRSVPRLALPQFASAFICNSSTAGQPVSRIDDVGFAVDDAFTRILIECHDDNVPQRI